MDSFAMAGIEWWNSLDNVMRRYWMDMAGSTSPAEAFSEYLRYMAEKAGRQYAQG